MEPETAGVHRPIVILSPLLPPLRGGLADHTALLARNLSAGRSVAVLSSRDVYTDAAFPIRAAMHDWEDGAELQLELDKTPFDSLLIWQYVPHMYGRGGVCRDLPRIWRAQRAAGRRQVVIAHEIAAPWGTRPNHWWYAWNHRRQWKAILESADLVPISTEAWTREWTARSPSSASKFLTLPSPSSIERVTVPPDHRTAWRAAQQVPPGTKVMVWWGSVSAAKQLMWVIDAWETACARLGPVLLCIVGGNPAVPIPGSLSPWVRMMGYLKNDEVSRVLQAADLVALPFSDGASERRTTLMAALGHGLATVTTAGHNTGPTLRAADFMSIGPADDEDSFIERTVTLLREDGARAAMARLAQAKHDAEYSWPVVTQRFLESMDRAGVLEVVPLPRR